MSNEDDLEATVECENCGQSVPESEAFEDDFCSEECYESYREDDEEDEEG